MSEYSIDLFSPMFCIRLFVVDLIGISVKKVIFEFQLRYGSPNKAIHSEWTSIHNCIEFLCLTLRLQIDFTFLLDMSCNRTIDVGVNEPFIQT